MTAEELLRDFEAMTHAERVRAAIALGRRGDAEGRALVAELEGRLAPSADERLRRIALAALLARMHTAQPPGAAERDRLRAYRGDPALLVAAAAQFALIDEADGADDE